ncbi:MAG: GNAT family protein [Bacteroidales bacterium]|jgi:diamine N-acetyltransferase|nr:GNAT family protein [Bacteroidales bacterium]MDD4703584.1 GNAT family protein [Bacteroidales bacterium]MDX9798945.1 GNAT family protein [Bacteroidales bacterium]
MNLRLRAVEISDADIIYKWENSYSLWGVSSTRAPFSHYAIEQYVKSTQNEDIYAVKQIRFMIDVDDDGTVKTVGCADLYDLEPQHSRAGVGIFVEEGDYRRRYIALNALAWIENYAFEILNLHQLFAHITQDNSISIKLFNKANYRQTSVLKDWIRKENQYLDVLVFQKVLTSKRS